MVKPVKLALLGSTGSIGRQTLDVISQYPEYFSVEALIANNNTSLLAEQARKYNPRYVVIANEERYCELKDELKDYKGDILSGHKAVLEAMKLPQIDMVVNATVGYSGLLPTLEAINAKKDISLANKETLVVAGEIVMSLAKENGVKIYPVDSEHSAIHQCLKGESPESIQQLIITASGGPFRKLDMTELESVTPAAALKHPNWQMGAKITIDSATMMNKAFEIIEAYWLFGIPAERIKPMVHPQSIVHSMVEFADGSVKAQLGVPDMRIPIKYALSRDNRLPSKDFSQHISLSQFATLTFEEPDVNKFPCLKFAYIALEKKGNSACIINAANEIAVDAFLKGKIKFTRIPDVIGYTLDNATFIVNPSVENYVESNHEARSIASEFIKKLN